MCKSIYLDGRGGGRGGTTRTKEKEKREGQLKTQKNKALLYVRVKEVKSGTTELEGFLLPPEKNEETDDFSKRMEDLLCTPILRKE